jgi:uncharacterized protein
VPVTVYIVSVVFFAMLVQSSVGFGAGLIGLPLLVLRIPFEVAAPMIGLMSLVTGVIIIAQDREHVHVRSVSWLLVSSFVGIPLGLWLLAHGSPHLLKGLLGLFLVAFAGDSMFVGPRWELKSDRPIWLCVCGFWAGVLGTAFATSGPPLVIYAAARRWTAPQFRATAQGFFLPSGIVIVAGYWLAGFWGRTVTTYFLYALPPALAALWIGRLVNRRLRQHAFQRALYVLLLAIGVLLVAQAVRGTIGKTRETASDVPTLAASQR